MFERYTEKARQVIFFARYEAGNLGSPVIEADCLLLGILRVDKALLLRHLSRPAFDELREKIGTRYVQRPPTSASVELPTSAEAKRILAYAAEEAERLAQSDTGVEHLLLGILREETSFPAKLLLEQGVSVGAVRKASAVRQKEARGGNEMGHAVGGSQRVAVQALSATSLQAIVFAWSESRALGRTSIEPEHLLSGLLRCEKSYAAGLLRQRGFTVEVLLAELRDAEAARRDVVLDQFFTAPIPAPEHLTESPGGIDHGI